MKTATITLGETEYVVHPFNIGELEQLTDAMGSAPGKIPFTVLKLALMRALPKVDNPALVEATAEEIEKAMSVIMDLSGMKRAEANNPNP